MLDWNRVISQTTVMVQARFADDVTGHDWWHVDRVRRLSIAIARAEGAQPELCELVALLHDLGDWKFHRGDESAGPRLAAEWLYSLQVPAETIAQVCSMIAGVSYKGAGVITPMPTLEGKCVQDADRLDALGAIGIARAFAYGGAKGRRMYDPDTAPEQHASFSAYKASEGPTLNHFYEKLLLLKDRMQTETGRRLAAERHAFMEAFVTQFLREWQGE